MTSNSSSTSPATDHARNGRIKIPYAMVGVIFALLVGVGAVYARFETFDWKLTEISASVKFLVQQERESNADRGNIWLAISECKSQIINNIANDEKRQDLIVSVDKAVSILIEKIDQINSRLGFIEARTKSGSQNNP